MTDALSAGHALDGSYQWGSETRAMGMATPEELQAQGYVKLSESPQYPGSWWMWKEAGK